MLSIERRREILEILRQRQGVSVEELAKRLFVSEATIRRDLDKLAHEGSIQRSYGGAVLITGQASETPLLIREGENRAAKERIAELAAQLVSDNDIIMMDSSSTVLRLVPHIARFERITAITHGLNTALKLHDLPGTTVHVAGGKVQDNTLSLVGNSTCNRINELNADIAFISCRGFSIERGVTDASEEEAQIKRSMIASSKKTVLLCDKSKLGQTFMVRVCEAKELYAIVSDAPFPQNIKNELDSSGIAVIT